MIQVILIGILTSETLHAISGELMKRGKLVKRLTFFAALFVLITFFASDAFAIQFTAHGYYRNRSEFLYNMDLMNPNTNPTYNNDRFGLISFNQMRLRVEPILKLNDYLSIHTQLDFLDNLVYGSSETRQLEVLSPVVGTITLPAGAGSLSMVGGAAGEFGSVNVRRAWAEVLTPVGKLRFGRQPSNWGLGIFQNDGNSRQADFGDTADRILFLTQKQFDNGGALSVGALWDIAFESQFDPTLQGLGGVVRDNGQDTNQWAGIITYEQSQFSFGLFGGIRKRDGGNAATMQAQYLDAAGALTTPTANNAGIDGDTLIYFIDATGKYSFKEYNFGFEFVFLGGEMSTGVAIDAIPFNGFNPNPGSLSNGVIQLPARQDVRVMMAAFEADARYKWGGEWKFKAGFAQGDAEPLSQRITQYGFRPDYNIALFMFDVPLGTSAAMVDPTTGDLLAGHLPITGNYVNNAIYVAATYKHHFDFSSSFKQCNDFSAGLRVVTAWAHKPPVKLDFRRLLGDNTLPAITGNGKWYGVELDVLVEGKFFDHLYASFEGGVLIPGSAYNISVDLIDPTGTMVSPISYDKAQLAYGGRLTMMLEF
jgi:uncharacterized protein (TIGR04551 family)